MDGTTSWDKFVVDLVDFANYIQLAEIWSHIQSRMLSYGMLWRNNDGT